MADPRPSSSAHLEDLVVEDVHILDYVKVLYKRRRLAVTVFLLVLLGTTAYTLMARPMFQAKVRLLIEAEEPNVVNFKEVISEDQAKTDYYTTQYNILQSRSLARKTLESLKLWHTPPFGGPGDPAVDEASAQSRATDRLLAHLSVRPIRDSRLVDILYELPDAALATLVVNTLALNYIDQNLEHKVFASKDAAEWLAARLAEQRQQVEAAERALQKYREQNGAISREDRENIVVQKLSLLNAEVTRAKTERIQQEAMYVQLQQLEAGRLSFEAFPAVLANTYIQQQKTVLSDLLRQQMQLVETFGDKNERIVAIRAQIAGTQLKIDGEMQKVVQSLTTEYQAAVAREKSLAQALDDQKVEALQMNGKAIEYSVLRREVESSQQIYNTLMQRAKETGVSVALKTSNIRIVDGAEQPRVPVSPSWPVSAVIGLVGGGVLAVGLVFFVEYMDSRLKTPNEITHHLRLPCLGLVPLLPAGQEASGYALLGRSAPARFADAMSVIRTNILVSSAGTASQSVLVTSTRPGEGKSLIAANLAVSLAQSGRRVLLIDANMRAPILHRLFDMPQQPGLSDHLVGHAQARDVVPKSSTEGLWVLPSGPVPPNPAELLGSPRCASYLQSVCAQFDWVVIDTPPVTGVADALIIAPLTSGVVVVVGADMTSRHSARRAVDQLEGTHAMFFGAVLNRADLDHHAYYFS
jgi:succinoglycan biosynthesis transport protein ExoP